MKFKRQKYDYYLILLTGFVLFVIGVICLYSIYEYNYLYSINQKWTKTIQYDIYVTELNTYLYPFVLLLLVTLGLCIPKRLFNKDLLIKFSVLLFIITIVLTIVKGIEFGISFILIIMIGIQTIVLILTIKKSSKVMFEREGFMKKIGSSLLHLGIVILMFNFVILKENFLQIPIFWAGLLMVTSGNILSFYFN